MPAVDIIGGGDRFTVRPLGLGPQLEGVDGTGFVDLVADGACRLGLAFAIQYIEPFKQIVDDLATSTLFHQLGVDGGGLGADIGHVDLLGIRQQLGTGRHLGSPGGKGKQSGYHAGNESLVH